MPAQVCDNRCHQGSECAEVLNREYVGRYHEKDSANQIDIDVEGIDTAEVYDSLPRLEKIADYVIANHNRKPHSRKPLCHARRLFVNVFSPKEAPKAP